MSAKLIDNTKAFEDLVAGMVRRRNEKPSDYRWRHLLPGCGHQCMCVSISEDILHVTCMVPGCSDSKQTHMDLIDVDVLSEFTLAVFTDALAREDDGNLS